MSNAFLTNTIWFVLLGILTAVEITVFLVKAKNRKTIIATYLTVSGITYGFEITIMTFLKSYVYHPMIMPQSPFDDSLIGNMFSQSSVPATAVLILVLNLKSYWNLIFAAAYGVIEELFIYLHIYEHHWYRTWMTLAGLLLLFWLTKKIYGSLDSIGHVRLYIYVYFGLLALHVNTMWIFKALGIYDFNGNLFSDVFYSRSTLAMTHNILLSNTLMAVYLKRIKWRWKAVIFPVIYIIHYIAYKLNLIYYTKGFFFLGTTLFVSSAYLYIFILYKLYDSKEKPSTGGNP